MTAPDAMRSLKMSFIIHWKVAGELVSPNNIMVGSECCLPFVSVLDSYIVVPPSNIEFRKVFGTLQLVHELHPMLHRKAFSYANQQSE